MTSKNKKYHILKKLGWGAFSTVWLGHDVKDNKFVAMKISKSEDCTYNAAEDEVEIM